MTKPISMAIVNDYEVVVRGLNDMLRHYEDHVRIVELDANEPVDEPVDIALYDTFGQTQGDRATMADLLSNGRVGRVVIYTWNFSRHAARTALDNGASGYLSKSLSATQLVAAIEAVHGGEQIVSPDPGRRPTVNGYWPGREEGLTAREAEVIALITQGLSNQEIADRASLSINSVKSYIRSGYRRIGVTSRSQAVLWGVEHGMRPDRMRVEEPDAS